jgi:exodeoxyribonuclease III
MKIASWNVNSLKVRLPHVLDWLERVKPDALCLQELKLEDKKFPLAELSAAGYQAAVSGQKTYNGVAILARNAPLDVVPGIPAFEDEQKRIIAATIGDARLVCAYFPNGQSLESDKFQYKLKWIAALTVWLKHELTRHPRLALLGDFNIAPEDRDVHDPKAWEGQNLVSEPERAGYRDLLALGFVDAFRSLEPAGGIFTWWDYRMNAFKRKMGMRIDHILLSPELAKRLTACTIDIEPRRLERPSDHAPIIAELAD